MILKPSEKSPLSAIRLAGLAKEAGLPDGVLNVVTGFGHEAGQALSRHNDIDAIAFTAVSYTHLDVYKRQLCDRLCAFGRVLIGNIKIF